MLYLYEMQSKRNLESSYLSVFMFHNRNYRMDIYIILYPTGGIEWNQPREFNFLSYRSNTKSVSQEVEIKLY